MKKENGIFIFKKNLNDLINNKLKYKVCWHKEYKRNLICAYLCNMKPHLVERISNNVTLTNNKHWIQKFASS
jgi:hypothetical protein